jgi:hypothetical protein
MTAMVCPALRILILFHVLKLLVETTHIKKHFMCLFSHNGLMTSNGKKNYCHPLSMFVALGGLVVSMLSTGPKVREFDPDRGQWIFKGDKNPEHHFPHSHIRIEWNLCGQWAGHSLHQRT